jgi:glycerol-3-phosphate acyltransferase PlsY
MNIEIVLLVGAYLVGAIPTSYLLVRFLKGMDIRAFGSGNSGATNTGRLLGAQGFMTVLLIDAAKAYAVLWAAQQYDAANGFAWMCMWALFIGNGYSIFLSFHGGKGVATLCGVLLALFPLQLAALYVGSFVVTYVLIRRVDAAALASVASGALAAALLYPGFYAWHAAGIAAWIWWRHRSNCVILWNLFTKSGE